MKLAALIALLLLSSATIYGQSSADLTRLLMESPIVEDGVWQDDGLLINRTFANGYHTWDKDSLIHIFLPKLWAERDSLLRSVDDFGSNNAIRYHYANGLFEFSNQIYYKMEHGAAWKVIADTVAHSTPIPDRAALAVTPIAYKYLHHLAIHELRDVSLKYREQGPEALTAAFGLPMDSLMSIAQRHGETFMAILLAKVCFPRQVHERYIAYRLMEAIGEKNLLEATAIRQEFIAHFPTSRFLVICDPVLDKLRETLQANAKDSSIIFLEKPDDLGSLDTLLESFRGNVVYLDIWGTWCGPCIDEILTHTHGLKTRFQHRKDLVFLYLAMDRDQDHQKWEQFVRLHAVSGFHLRKNEAAIEPFWVALLHTENVPRSYPTYAIFDRSGSLVTAEAMRPSQGEDLYRQLQEVLGED